MRHKVDSVRPNSTGSVEIINPCRTDLNIYCGTKGHLGRVTARMLITSQSFFRQNRWIGGGDVEESNFCYSVQICGLRPQKFKRPFFG